MKKTLKKFRHPKSLVKEYEHWLLLCRYEQKTLGSLVLICKDKVYAFSDVSSEGFAELHRVVKEIEKNLKELFQNDKINYLMFMMDDPEVHFHVIPRYAEEREFGGVVFEDAGWPDTPAKSEVNEIDESVFEELVETLKQKFA
jgi:diadenosine tetraphosphate (Ap4A) HIT family hydrolase